MASLVQEIAEQAQIAFSKSFTDESFTESFSELVKLINRLQASDLNVTLDAEEDSKPVISKLICQNELFTIAMFVLQNGGKIPLHDHPEMHGIIKVVLGTIKMTTYSPISNDYDEIEIPEEIQLRQMSNPTDSLIPVQLHMSKNVTSKDEPVIITPTVGNYHEMIAVEGPAVMFDILGPPYEMDPENIHYFTVLESKDSSVQCKIWLLGIQEEHEYWCFGETYTGPKVSL